MMFLDIKRQFWIKFHFSVRILHFVIFFLKHFIWAFYEVAWTISINSIYKTFGRLNTVWEQIAYFSMILSYSKFSSKKVPHEISINLQIIYFWLKLHIEVIFWIFHFLVQKCVLWVFSDVVHLMFIIPTNILFSTSNDGFG